MVEGDDSQLAPDGNRTLLHACTPSGDSVHIRRGQIGSAASPAATVAKRLGGLQSVTPTRCPPTLLGSPPGSDTSPARGRASPWGPLRGNRLRSGCFCSSLPVFFLPFFYLTFFFF